MPRVTVLLILLPALVAARAVPTLSLDFETGFDAIGRDGPVKATLEGTPELVPGKFGNALKSGSASGYLHFPTAGIVLPEQGTVEMWVCPVDWKGTEEFFHVFFDVRGDGALYLYKYYQGGLLMLSCPNVAGPYHSASAPIAPWVPGEWHHIAGTWSAREQHVYIDGKRIGSAEPALPTRLGADFVLGDNPWHIPRTTSSLIDQVRIYDRCLSDAHVAAHFAGDYDRTVGLDEQSATLKTSIDPERRSLAIEFSTSADDTAGVEVGFTIAAGGQTKSSAAPQPLRDGLCAAGLSLAGLPPGDYELAAAATRGDQPVATIRRKLVVPSLEWVGNTLGLERRVLPPWTPVTQQADPPGKGVQLGCLGRRYDLGASGLPSQLTSVGAPLLAGPVTVSLKRGGVTTAFAGNGVRVANADPVGVETNGTAQIERATLRTHTRTEYDGLTVLDLTLDPTGAYELEAVTVDIPLRPEVALYRHRWAASWAGETGNLPAGDGVVDKSPFLPYYWLGDNDRGLFWFCETGQQWPNYAAPNAVEVVRENGRVVLRLNLLAGQKPPQPWTFRFGLQATPAKPLPRDWRRRRMSPAPRADIDILWPTPNPDSQSYYGYPQATTPELFDKRVKAIHDGKRNAIPYSCLSFFSGASPEWPWFEKAWTTGGGDSGSSDVAAYGAVFEQINPTSKSYSDFILWKNVQFMERYGLDGYYHDNTHPYGFGPPARDCGWLDDKGWHPTYPILAYRDLYRRLYTAVKERKPDAWLMAHMSGKVTIPILAYEDAYLDGEHFRGRVKDSYLDLLPLDTFRAEFMGRQWGIQPFFLPEFSQEEAARVEPTRGLMGLLLVHDVQPWPIWCNIEPVKAMYDALDAFGYVDSDFLPYFDPQPPARVDGMADVYVSVYKRADGRALAVIANVSREARSGVVTFAGDRIGVPVGSALAWPARTPLAKAGAGYRLDLPGLDYRLVLLGKAP
ncbi:MAG: LamG domain-containing protein [Armatimonadetes bacterium]|nr:LamG domain-containing protein [Armatimonadota bacterium]